MVKALAPSFRRGSSWVWLCIVIAGLAGSPLRGQSPDGKGASKNAAPAKASPAPKAEAQPKTAPAPVEEKPDDPGASIKDSGEIFKDPNAEEALANTFTQIPYPPVRSTPQDATAIRNMAAGSVQPDPALIDRYVATQASELTNRTNIRAIIDPPPGLTPSSQSARAIERASDALIEPLAIARSAQPQNRAFLALYLPTLQSKLTPLLSNHHLARIEAAIALGTAGSPAYVDLFLKQLADEKQVIVVKVWAARGLTNVTQNGQVALEASKAGQVAAALAKVLEDPDFPWPGQIRVLEALASNRIGSSSVTDRKADVLSTVVGVLADPDARPDVRAWAAWAIGMINANSAIGKINYPLITQHIGLLTAEIGDRIGDEYDQLTSNFERQKGPATYMTGLLVYQIEPALSGVPNVRNSGLINIAHPSAVANKPFATALDAQVKNVARAALELIRAGGMAQETARKNLAVKVADLRTFLDSAKTKPTDLELISGGEKFPFPAPFEAPAPAAAPKNAAVKKSK